jgi:hypothetical protein
MVETWEKETEETSSNIKNRILFIGHHEGLQI